MMLIKAGEHVSEMMADECNSLLWSAPCISQI